ncbi:MAG: alpha/beta fold hydrolase [Actinobacteria bacterium]|nr:alpha/beta fold hydrolase [Actinomycetota bacterium]
MNSRGTIPRPHSRSRTAAVVAATALLLSPLAAMAPAGATGPGRAPLVVAADDFPADLAPYYTQTLAWETCKDGLTCSWLTVPLDYANPTGPTIRLRVSRAQATGPADSRQGSLVINPGGPGASGTDFAAYVATSITPKVNEAFDVVGFDPRGVGKSAPITCLTGRQTTVWLRQDGTPNTPAEERRLMSLAAAIPQGCLQMSPALARNVGTENTVRDMDILRQALGDQKLNWLGFSYGTYMGTLYAEQFPDRVGRFVLDGAVDPANDSMEMSLGQSRGFQVAMGRFAADCSRRATCPFRGNAKAVLAGVNRLFAKLDAKPMPAGKGRVLTQAEAMTAVFTSMYSTQFWPWLRTGLRQSTRNDGTELLAIADYANDRTGPNTYATNMASAFYAIACWDSPAAPGVDTLRAAAAEWSRNAPVPEMAAAMSWGNAPCSQWYGHTSRVPAPASSTTTAPILVIGTTFDPATPYPWAVALSNQLTTSTLLTYRGDGHTAFGSGSACIDKSVDAYLLTGLLPPKGRVCR